MKAIWKIVACLSLAKSPRITYATGIMVVGRELAGHPPDAVPPQAFRAAEPICPACGYETSATFKWCHGGCLCPLANCEKALLRNQGDVFAAAHLHRQCQQCAYEWPEPCLKPGAVEFK